MLRRILAIAGLTLKESARKRVSAGMIICSVLMTLSLGLVARSMQANEGSDFGLAAAVYTLLRVVAAFTWVLAIFISVTAIPPEFERRTTYTLFAKPVERYEFVFGKFLGCFLLLAGNLAVIAALVWLMLGREDPKLTMDMLRNLGAFCVSYTALIALAISFTLVAPMPIAALLSLGIYFLASVYGYGLQVAETARLHPFWRAVGSVVFFVGRYATPRVNWLNTDRPFYQITGHTQLEASLYVLAYSVVVLILGAVVFSRREL